MPGHGERILHTFDEWVVRINKRVQRLERRLAHVQGGAGASVLWQEVVRPASFDESTNVASVATTFPAGLFTSAPQMYTNARTQRPNLATSAAGTATTNGVTVYLYQYNNSATNVNVLAVQAAAPLVAAVDVELASHTVVCHTAGCGNVDLPMRLILVDADGNTPGQVVCGVCGQPITDIEAIVPSEEE